MADFTASVWATKLVSEPTSLALLDSTLQSKVYFDGSALSSSDETLFLALHPILSAQSAAETQKTPSVLRYFDHLQRSAPKASLLESVRGFAIVEFELESYTPGERKAEAPKVKKPKAAAAAAEVAPVAKEAVVEAPKEAEASEQDPSKKTQKKEKKPKAAAAPGSAAAGGSKNAPVVAGPPNPGMLDLRVGHIISVEKHPEADSLYIETIDVGEAEPRVVVSGLVKYIPIEEMQGKVLICVCNLKPAAMRGVKSFAMVLAASSPDGKDGGVELVDPPAGSKPGDRVYFEGFQDSVAETQLNPKKKIFETIQPGFTTLAGREAAWVDAATGTTHKIVTHLGECKAPTFVGASLS